VTVVNGGPSRAFDPQVVPDVSDAGGHLGEILGAALEAAAGDGAREGDRALLHGHVDVGGILVNALVRWRAVLSDRARDASPPGRLRLVLRR
jgi:hypothetical protein